MKKSKKLTLEEKIELYKIFNSTDDINEVYKTIVLSMDDHECFKKDVYDFLQFIYNSESTDNLIKNLILTFLIKNHYNMDLRKFNKKIKRPIDIK